MAKIDVSVVILNYNTPELTIDCIESVIKYTKKITHEIIVVDNASADDSIKRLKDYELRIKIVKNKKNLGFAGGNNSGIKKAVGRYVLLLNSDTYLTENTIKNMVDYMDKHDDIGLGGCALKNVDGSFQQNGGYFPNLWRVFAWMFFIDDIPLSSSFIKSFHPHSNYFRKSRQPDWLTGAFLMIKRDVINKVGYLDDAYFMYTEDTDYCYRARNEGFQMHYNARESIVHLGGASSSSEFPAIREFSGVKTFYQKHYPAWQYLILRLFLKLGSLIRIIIKPKIYAKAFARA